MIAILLMLASMSAAAAQQALPTALQFCQQDVAQYVGAASTLREKNAQQEAQISALNGQVFSLQKQLDDLKPKPPAAPEGPK